MAKLKCYACDRKLSPNPYIADTRDGQYVFIGANCFANVRKAGDAGWQPPKGGPRLFSIPRGLSQDELEAIRVSAKTYQKSLI